LIKIKEKKVLRFHNIEKETSKYVLNDCLAYGSDIFFFYWVNVPLIYRILRLISDEDYFDNSIIHYIAIKCFDV